MLTHAEPCQGCQGHVGVLPFPPSPVLSRAHPAMRWPAGDSAAHRTAPQRTAAQRAHGVAWQGIVTHCLAYAACTLGGGVQGAERGSVWPRTGSAPAADSPRICAQNGGRNGRAREFSSCACHCVRHRCARTLHNRVPCPCTIPRVELIHYLAVLYPCIITSMQCSLYYTGT